jgi:hypothetical protein
MSKSAKVLRQRLKDNFPFYAKNCLFIRTKDSGVQPFILNKAQQYIHSRIEEQLKDTGKVRAILLKGRQQGASTYVEGRFMWKTTHKKGVSAFILTHEDDASQNLFGMAKRYYDNLPEYVRPLKSASNAKELRFEALDSGYRVGTAGNKSVGRSQTNQYFHGSEMGFWPNAAEHAKGVLQTVPDSNDSEVIYESTANGVGNFFHQQWKLAESGASEFIAIFVPWFWQDEYKKNLPDNFLISLEEAKVKKYYDLCDEQIYWRRQKIMELSAGGKDGEIAFMQEYPMNAAEAFQVSGGVGLIKQEVVVKARKASVDGLGPLVVGVDPSRGGDRFSMIKRQGRKMYGKRSWTGDEIDTLGKAVSKCKAILDDVCPIAGKVPDMLFIDAGCGVEIADRLHELGYDKRVKAIYFGSTPLDDLKYKNKRGEMWGLLAEWLNDENLAVELPDDDELQADLMASPYDRDSHDRIVLWRKERIKEKYGFSPDDGDACALTFAEPVKQKKANVKKYPKMSIA